MHLCCGDRVSKTDEQRTIPDRVCGQPKVGLLPSMHVVRRYHVVYAISLWAACVHQCRAYDHPKSSMRSAYGGHASINAGHTTIPYRACDQPMGGMRPSKQGIRPSPIEQVRSLWCACAHQSSPYDYPISQMPTPFSEHACINPEYTIFPYRTPY